ncbi:MAG: lysophospholipid acyltransferase family protein [Hyphomicrobiaceae bacterium]
MSTPIQGESRSHDPRTRLLSRVRSAFDRPRTEPRRLRRAGEPHLAPTPEDFQLPPLTTPNRAGSIRAALVLAAFAGLTIPLLPVQAALKRSHRRAARTFPNWYHRRVARLLGLRIAVDGAIDRDRPVLLVANHTSWLDIVVLSAVAPVSFVAKREVSGWPGVGLLARLQQTVFVDRTRRTSVGETASEIATRLAQRDAIVLFAEGTSTDGNRLLPFKSSLFGAVVAAPTHASQSGKAMPPLVQTVTLAYTRVQGVTLGRADRPLVGWYGDMEMADHAWQLLKTGPLDVAVRIGEPRDLSEFSDRKTIAAATELEIRAALTELLRDPNAKG